VIIADGRRQIIKIVHKGDYFGYAVGVRIFVPEWWKNGAPLRTKLGIPM
jgi:hypothetical protein